MQLLVPKKGDSPTLNVIFLWLNYFFFYLRLESSKTNQVFCETGKRVSSETVNERVEEKENVEDWGVMRHLCSSEEMPSVLCQSPCS